MKDSDGSWWWAFLAVVALSFATRFYKVSEPDHVCWDETHFGKMGSWYINRTFFFDVHPPLGKMLIALSGYLTGYDGKFAFDKPGDKYENVNYVGMRIFCTTLGACLAPLAFLIVWELTFSVFSAVLASSLVLFDIGVLILTQYILLDPILLFFVMSSTYGLAKFNNCDKHFSGVWWFWLCFTGVMLSCSISVKFVGLFVVLLVGSHTLCQLWDIFGDTSIPVSYSVRHFLARVAGLIVLPAALYCTFFYIHLTVLSKSGNGDGFYSSAFQSLLEGNSLHNASMPKELAYGAIITLKNHRTGGGYLHSHWHLYPEGVGASQQQITTYTHKDENNRWVVKPFDKEPDADELSFVRHGDLIRLEHVSTRRNLHSHREQAPITRKHLQVTGYGENGTGDANDVWKVLIVNGGDNDVVTTVRSKIKLVHFLQQCILTTTGKQLPKWGYEQQEVSCNPNLRDKFGIWNVEDNYYPKLPNISFQLYAPSFFERLIESHAVMLQGNAGLKPKEGEITSRPWQWPINFRGQFFSGSSYRIYLLGNPIIWWSNLVFLFIYVCIVFFCAVKRQRNLYEPSTESGKGSAWLSPSVWLFIGWLLHYVPFWAMGRVLYFHHYFPALLYNSMLTGVTIDYILRNISSNSAFGKTLFHWIFSIVLGSAFYSFYKFSPLAYGMDGPYSNDANSSMHGLKWMDSWEF